MVQHIPTILLEILVDTYVDVCVLRMKDSRYIVEQTNILCTGCHVKLDNVWSGLRLCIHYFIAPIIWTLVYSVQWMVKVVPIVHKQYLVTHIGTTSD